MLCNLSKADTCLKRTKILVPIVSALDRFHCTVIIHCGTNSLQAYDSPDALAQEIIDLATSLKNDDNEVMISSIICRGKVRVQISSGTPTKGTILYQI